MKPKYGDNITLAYTDTDSFIYHIKTECIYSDVKQLIDKFDTSDYPKYNPYNLPLVNKKVPGLFKDELNGLVIAMFIGLRSKMYCVQADGIDKMKKAKGVKKYVLKKEINFKDYYDCLKNQETIAKDQNTFRSKLHKMYTITQNKIALSPFDDKRYIEPNFIDTLAWVIKYQMGFSQMKEMVRESVKRKTSIKVNTSEQRWMSQVVMKN